jgi:hypothetical protein
MAITATWTQESRKRIGRDTHVKGYFTLTGSATAGGFAVSASTFGLNRLDDVVPDGIAMSATGGTAALGVAYDKTAGKLTVWETAGTVDLPFDESDLASTTGYLVRCLAIGK